MSLLDYLAYTLFIKNLNQGLRYIKNLYSRRLRLRIELYNFLEKLRME